MNRIRDKFECGSAEMGIKRTSLCKILTKLNMKTYIPRFIHGLLEDDPDGRSQFCEHFVSYCEDNTTFLNQILWTDEAAFKLSRHANRHNCVYWSDKNPHFTIATELNQPGIIVWAGILSARIVGPVFFEGTVSGEKYLEKLKTAIVPALKKRPDFNSLVLSTRWSPTPFCNSCPKFPG